MKHSDEFKFFNVFFTICFILVIIGAIFEICLVIRYADTPASEIPLWVLYLLFIGGGN